MSRKDNRAPETPATRFLKQHRVAYSTHLYEYEPHGGTAVSARELNLPEHAIIKTLVMQDENGNPFMVLMHGDRKVSTRELARHARCKRVETCSPETATRYSGYLIGGTSPFGTRRKLTIYMEKTILDLPIVHVNGGRRGFLIGIHPHDIVSVLDPVLVNAGTETHS